MSIDNMQQQESLAGIFLNAVIIQIDFPETQKYGEAVVRIPALHGDSSQTPDDALPAALFYQKAFPASFGTFDVGDNVLVSFMNGDRSAPVIEGKVFDLDKVARTIPEYSEHYGKIKGMYSDKAQACFFFNEADSSIVIRVMGGTVITLTKGKAHIKSPETHIETDKAHIDSSGDIDIVSGGQLNIKSDSAISLKAPIIKEN